MSTNMNIGSKAEDNPFELTPRQRGNSPKRPVLICSTEKIEEFIEIPLDYWETIKYGTTIRYILLNETEYKYGHVFTNPHYYNARNENKLKPSTTMKAKETEKTLGFKLISTLNPNVTNKFYWTVPYDKIIKLFVKMDICSITIIQTLNNTICTLNANLKKITDYIKKLEDRIRQLESR
jgi:hypothetical protein